MGAGFLGDDKATPLFDSGDGICDGRPGHIPGSANVPAVELTDAETGLYRPAGELALLFEEAGAVRTNCLAMLDFFQRRLVASGL